MTPTPEQIEAERTTAAIYIDKLDGFVTAYQYGSVYALNDGAEDFLCEVIATARLEGEAKGRERGLDEAAAIQPDITGASKETKTAVLDWWRAILALKEKP